MQNLTTLCPTCEQGVLVDYCKLPKTKQRTFGSSMYDKESDARDEAIRVYNELLPGRPPATIKHSAKVLRPHIQPAQTACLLDQLQSCRSELLCGCIGA